MANENSIFTKIINKEIPSAFVYEDDICAVFMDKFPEVSGKCLVVPKKETDYIFDLEDETYTHLFKVSKQIAKALDRVYETEKTVLLVEGFEVSHVHIKLYPIRPEHIDGAKTPLHGGSEISLEEAEAEAQKIREVLE